MEHPLVKIAEKKEEVQELRRLAVIPNAQDNPLVNQETFMERLSKLGFTGVVKKAGRMVRMKTAYSDYLFVTPQHIQDFNDKLKKETLREDKRAYHFKTLVFIPLEKYSAIPSVFALNALEVAQTRGIFDCFVVCKIDWKTEIKDPIIFGRIEGCEDYFFISQWDDDVKIEEIIFG